MARKNRPEGSTPQTDTFHLLSLPAAVKLLGVLVPVSSSDRLKFVIAACRQLVAPIAVSVTRYDLMRSYIRRVMVG